MDVQLQTPVVGNLDPQLDDLMNFMKFAYGVDKTYRGTVQFCLTYPCGGVFKKSVQISDEGAEVYNGDPPNNSVSCKVYMSRDTFMKVYKNELHPQTAIFSGKMSVGSFKFGELQSFAACFDTSTDRWNAYYEWLDTQAALCSFEGDDSDDESAPLEQLLDERMRSSIADLGLEEHLKLDVAAVDLLHSSSRLLMNSTRYVRASKCIVEKPAAPGSMFDLVRNSMAFMGNVAIAHFELMGPSLAHSSPAIPTKATSSSPPLSQFSLYDSKETDYEMFSASQGKSFSERHATDLDAWREAEICTEKSQDIYSEIKQQEPRPHYVTTELKGQEVKFDTSTLLGNLSGTHGVEQASFKTLPLLFRTDNTSVSSWPDNKTHVALPLTERLKDVKMEDLPQQLGIWAASHRGTVQKRAKQVIDEVVQHDILPVLRSLKQSSETGMGELSLQRHRLSGHSSNFAAPPPHIHEEVFSHVEAMW